MSETPRRRRAETMQALPVNPEKPERPEKKEKAPIVIAGLILLCVLWEIPQIFDLYRQGGISRAVMILGIVLGGAALAYVHPLEHKWLWPFLLAPAAILLAAALQGSSDILLANMSALRRSFLPYVTLPALALLVSEGDMRKLLRVFCALWTILFAFLGCVGIYCAVTGAEITNSYWGYFIRAWHGMFQLSDDKNNTGVNFMSSIMIALVGCAVSGKKWPKVLYVLSMVPMLIALSITDNRTGFVAIGIGFGAFVAGLIMPAMQKKNFPKIIRAAVSMVLVAVFMAGMLKAVYWTRDRVNDYITDGSLPILSSAEAEETEEEKKADTLKERDFMQDDMLTGRITIWKGAVNLLKSNPKLVLTGGSVEHFMTYLGEFKKKLAKFDHLHCMPLMILAETGIFGFTLFVIAMFLFFRAIWRLWLNGEIPLWQRTIFIPALTMVAVEMVECMTRVQRVKPMVVVMMLFMGMTICYSMKLSPKEQKHLAEQDAALTGKGNENV